MTHAANRNAPYIVSWSQYIGGERYDRWRSFSYRHERDRFVGVLNNSRGVFNVSASIVEDSDFERSPHAAPIRATSFPRRVALTAAALAIAAGLSACGTVDITPPAPQGSQPLPTFQHVTPPMGYTAMCVREPDSDACTGGTDIPRVVTMTPERWQVLNEVDRYANALPEFDDGDGDYWREAGTRGGDCEDIALEKRRLLIERGFPAEALLLATVKRWNDGGHAVLLVETDRGELLLDNLAIRIERASDAPYTWMKRQSARRPFVWLNMQADKATDTRAELPPIGKPPFLAVLKRFTGRKS